MEKVFITKVLANKETIKSIGLLDKEAKKLLVPFVSKKGTPMISVVDYDYCTKTDNGYCLEVVTITDEDRHFVNVYYVNPVKGDK